MDYKTHWWRIDIFINSNNPYLIFTLFPRMKQSIKQSGQNLIYPKQRIERISMEVTTKSSHIESYLLTHSNHPFLPSFHCHTIHPMRCDHSLLPVESPKSKQTTNHFHPIQQFLFHHANQHPLYWINSQCVVELLHLDGYFLTNTSFLPSFLPCLLYDFQCGIQEFNIHTHIIPLPILFPFHTLQNQMKNWKSHSHCFLSKQFHSSLHPLEILFIPFISNNHTQYSKNTMEPLLDILLFHSLQRLVQFSSVTSWRGFCLTISLMGSLGVFGCVF